MVFLLDASVAAINAGLFQCSIQAIRVSLEALAKKRNHTMIGLAMVDVRTHFICGQGERVHDVIGADYEESFACVSPHQWLIEVTEDSLDRV